MKKVLFAALGLWLGMIANATVVNYTADNTTVFRNPERGFTEELGGETMLTDSKNHVIKAEGEWYFDEEENPERKSQSIMVVIYYLGNYKSKDLSQAILTGFDEDMQILRDKGFKCVLRFAYDWNSKNDASLTWVKKHISQLKPYLAKNADVIYVLQTGFVGQWGEWYYSSNFGNETQHLNDNRRQVVTAMLDACPANRFLLVRYSMIKSEYLGSTSNPDNAPLTADEAFSGSVRSRIGHHNDAFLNTYGNEGTYASSNKSDDPAVRKYIAAETLYVPNGGETNVESSSLAKEVAKYDSTMAELRRYHWSFCGSTYAERVTNIWRNNGTFEEMDRKLGYRYQLVTATFPEKANIGGKAAINIQIKNVGFAPIYNERHAYIVLKNGNKTYSVPLQSDPRRWLPNDAVTTVNEKITIPSNVPAGTYQLYLHLPDAATTLAADPRYAVRFANIDVWDANTGMNSLKASITLQTGTDDPENPDPEIPTPIDPTPDTDAIILPATLNKANVASYSSDMTWYNTDYFNFGSDDEENTSRWAAWKVYLRYPGQYNISAVAGFPGDDNADGFQLQLDLLKTETVVKTFTGNYTWAEANITYTNKWDLSTMAVGEYTLRARNIAEWEQPKLKSVTIEYNGTLPTKVWEIDASAQDNQAYDILGRPADDNYRGIVIRKGRKEIR